MMSINNDIRVRRSGRSMPVIAAIALTSLLVSLFASLVPYNVSAATVTLFSDSFESGNFTSWSFADNDWKVINDTNVGSKAAEAKGADGDELLRVVSTAGRASLTFSYWFKIPGGIGATEHVKVQWSNDGADWNTLVDYVGTSTAANWTSASFTLPATAENQSGFRFRIFAYDFTNSGTKFRLDDVKLVSGSEYNVAPVATNASATTAEDTAVSGTLSATDSDIPAQTLTYSIVANPTHGTVTGLPNTTGAYTYTPAANYNGSDSFTFKANDGTANSNTATISIDVTPVNDLPVITLTGATPVTVAFGGTYTEQGASADDVEDGSNLTVTDITGSVDTNTTGSYTITYNFTDTDGGVATPVTRTVNVTDQGAPVVTITPGTQTIEATGPTGAVASYTVSAIDDADGDISGTASCDVASGSTFAIGNTTITCSATDSNSNTGTGSATVTVEDTTAPVITLNGSSTITFVVGGTYAEAGADAFDTVDGTTTATVGGDVVDGNTIGTYVVTYNATDAHGNVAAQVTRTVTVVAQPVENDANLCSDGIDNDGDTAIDLADSDCAAFVPPTPPAPTGNGGGNGGGGGGGVVSGPLSIGFVNTNNGGEVLGASTELPNGCSAYLTSYLKKGSTNASEVKKLQTFLNEEMGTKLPVTGFFGQLTFNAVSAFQAKYASDVLKPWFDQKLSNDMNPSGYVYKMTLYKINLIQCASLNAPVPQLP